MKKQKCKRCGEVKSLEEFHVSNQKTIGRKATCIKCEKELRQIKDKNMKATQISKTRPCTKLEKECYVYFFNREMTYKEIAKMHNREEDFIEEVLKEKLPILEYAQTQG